VGNYFLQNYRIRKYFLQNLLRKVFYTKSFAKKLAGISCKFFFSITKFINISYKKKIKTKLTENMSFLEKRRLREERSKKIEVILSRNLVPTPETFINIFIP